MFNRLLRRFVDRVIDERIAAIPQPVSPPQGYNPLEAIRGGMYHWVQVPVNNSKAWMQLRTSNATQLEACGAITLVESVKNNTTASQDELIEMWNRMESICKITMNDPTFDNFIKMITDSDFVHSNMRLELERIKAIDCTGMSATEKSEIDDMIRNIELHLAYLLPENTMTFIVRWALGVDVTDIKKVSDEKLLEMAILATNNNNSPHDNCHGCFSDFNPSDLDKAAWMIFNDYQSKKAIEKQTGRKWIGGNK